MFQTEKRILCLLVCLFMLVSLLPRLPVAASGGVTEGSCGENVSWTLSDTGILTISGNGEMADYDPWYDVFTPWHENSLLITEVIIQDGVTSIGEFAFKDCSNLAAVTIAGTVTSIGQYAFNECTALTAVTVPENVTKIDYSAFKGCSALVTVNLPESLTDLGGSVFYGCAGLTSITLPEKLERIGHNGFDGCSSLTSVVIPANVPKLETEVFKDCAGLTSVILPEDLLEICDGVFSGCGSLTEITIPDSVINFGSYIFRDCTKLTSVTLPEGLEYISGGMFSGCSGLTSAPIPDTVTCVEGYAFSGCSGLTAVTLPERVTYLGGSAFSGCSKLETVTIPDGVTVIRESTFNSCAMLSSITLPATLTTMEKFAFSNCFKLSSITFIGDAPDLDPYCFSTVSATVHYPCTAEGWDYSVRQNHSGSIIWKPGHSYGEDGLCTLCGQGPEFIITMNDDLIDSWIGGGIKVYADDSLLTTLTLSSGRSAQITVPGILGTVYTFKWDSASRDDRCIFEIAYDGEVLASGLGNDYANNEIICIKESTCNHQYESVITDPTCREDGYTTHTCKICGSSYTSDETPATGHDFGEDDLCRICGEYTEFLISMRSVGLGDWNGAAIDVYIDGEFYMTASLPDGADNHSVLVPHYPGKEYVFKWVSGVSDGQCYFYINKGSMELVSASGSDYHDGEIIYPLCDHQYELTVTAPTCTEGGFTTYLCSLCANTYIDDETPAAGHSYDENALCTTCGQAMEVVISMRDTYNDGWNGACIEIYADGEWMTTASNISAGTDEVRFLSAPGVIYTFKWIAGLYDNECHFEISIDGEILKYVQGDEVSDGEIFFRLAGGCVHSYQMDIRYPTCTESGFYVHTCPLCGDSYTTNEVPAMGHSYENGVCTECGDRESVELPGDITGDGKLNIIDVVRIYAIVKGVADAENEEQLACADFNGDGKINIIDTALLYNKVKTS